jgi:hypothetical protein
VEIQQNLMIARSCNTKSEVCSLSNSTSSATIVERNCDDSEKKKDELSSGESVQDRTSSSRGVGTGGPGGARPPTFWEVPFFWLQSALFFLEKN